MPLTGEAKREYQREWMRKRRERAIEYLGGKCEECGTTEELEFDHDPPEAKVRSINSLLSYSWEKQKEELDKCCLLCRTHHREYTNSDLGNWIHGTLAMYQKECRCDKCRAANSERVRRQARESTRAKDKRLP